MTSAKAMASELGLINEKGAVGAHLVTPDRRFFKEAFTSPKYNLAMYSVLQPLPRAYFASKVEWAQSHQSALDKVSRPDQSGFDPLAVTILERTRAQQQIPVSNISPTAVSQSSVAIAVDTPDYVRLQLITPVENFLIITDQYYPGWHAMIDGQPARIYPANVLFRAIFVPAGTHRIEFTYAPNSLRWGLTLSGVAIILLLTLLVAAIAVRFRD